MSHPDRDAQPEADEQEPHTLPATDSDADRAGRRGGQPQQPVERAVHTPTERR